VLPLAESLHNSGKSEEALAHLTEAIARNGSVSSFFERRAHILREMDREQEAIADLDEAILLNPYNYMNWYTRGLAYKDIGQYEASIRDFKASIERESAETVISTYYEIGMAYYFNGQFEEAIDYFKRTIPTSRVVPTYFYMLSCALDALDRTEEAIETVLSGMKLLDTYEAQPDHGYQIFANATNYSYGAFQTFRKILAPTFSLRHTLAKLYAKQGEHEAAAKALTEAIQLYPDAAALYLQRGRMYQAQDKFEQALEDYEITVRLAPDNAGGYAEQVSVHRAREDEGQALLVLQQFREAEPQLPLAIYWLADSYYRLGKHGEALRVNRELLAIEDDDHYNYRQLGDIHMGMGQLAEAESAYARAVELNDTAETRSKLSYTYYLQDKHEAAMIELQQVARLDPDAEGDASYHVRTGHVYAALQEHELAVAAFSKAIEIAPDNPKWLEYRAQCYLEHGEMEPASADCTRGILEHPGYARFYSIRGNISYLQEKYEQARFDALSYIELEPRSSDGYYNLGVVDYATRDYEEALGHFIWAIQLEPAYAPSYLYKARIYFDQMEFELCIESIVNWVLNVSELPSPKEKMNAIESLGGFDDSILSRAVARISSMYGEALYLS